MEAKLILENGSVFSGEAFGYLDTQVGEVVFNTGMTGYQEVLTDPSYCGQIIVMTYPLIGNYGINLDDFESTGIKAKGLIVREKCAFSSNFRSEFELEQFLKQNKIMGIEGIDTRALTRVIRSSGTMRGIITTDDLSEVQIQTLIEGYSNKGVVYSVCTKVVEHFTSSATENSVLPRSNKKIALIDYGAKTNILRELLKRNCDVTLYPAWTKAEDILVDQPDLVFLSNGPGNPEDLETEIEELKKLIGVKPVVGICLGHQLIALASNGETSKLKFGHRGCNHPVKDLEKNRVYITSQNHGYCVTKMPKDFEVTHINVNDGSVEGMRHTLLPVFSVQFHPEASPGPRESDYLFDEFIAYAE